MHHLTILILLTISTLSTIEEELSIIDQHQLNHFSEDHLPITTQILVLHRTSIITGIHHLLIQITTTTIKRRTIQGQTDLEETLQDQYLLTVMFHPIEDHSLGTITTTNPNKIEEIHQNQISLIKRETSILLKKID